MDSKVGNPFLMDENSALANIVTVQQPSNPFLQDPNYTQTTSASVGENPFLNFSAEQSSQQSLASTNPFATSTMETGTSHDELCSEENKTVFPNVMHSRIDLASTHIFDGEKMQIPDIFSSALEDCEVPVKITHNETSSPSRPPPPKSVPPLPPRNTQDLILSVTGAMDATSSQMLDRLQNTRTPSPTLMHSPSPTPEHSVADLLDVDNNVPDIPDDVYKEIAITERLDSLDKFKGENLEPSHNTTVDTELTATDTFKTSKIQQNIFNKMPNETLFAGYDSIRENTEHVISGQIITEISCSIESENLHADLKVAFTSVDSGRLWEAMEKMGVEIGLVERVMKVYEEAKYRVIGEEGILEGFWMNRRLRLEFNAEKSKIMEFRKGGGRVKAEKWKLEGKSGTGGERYFVPELFILEESGSGWSYRRDSKEGKCGDETGLGSGKEVVHRLFGVEGKGGGKGDPRNVCKMDTWVGKEFAKYIVRRQAGITSLGIIGWCWPKETDQMHTIEGDPVPIIAPPPRSPQNSAYSDAPLRFNPFDKSTSIAQDAIIPTAITQAQVTRSDSQETPPTPLFDEDVSQPLEDFPRVTYTGDGWEMQLRQPNKKKITGQRFWKKIFVRLVYQGENPVVQLSHSRDDKDPFQELPLLPCYSVSDIGAQQFDQYGKIFTVKVQYIFYKERPGVRPGQVTKAERLTNKLSQFAAYAIQGDYQGVKEFGSDLKKLGLPVEHAPQVSQLFKLGSQNYEDMKEFSSAIEEALFTLPAHRDRALQYKMEEVQIAVVDELYVEQTAEGHVQKQIARVRLFFLGFLSGMPDVELGINDMRRQGKEVVGRHDIIPVVTEEWIRLENVEFHSCIQQDEYEDSRIIRFKPPDACYIELMRFRVRPPKNRELPLQLKCVMCVTGNKVDIRADILVPGFSSRKLGQIPCEDVMVRIPIPECWIYLFRVEKHFRYGSVKSAHRRTGKIKGIERFLGAVDNLEPQLMEATSGQAKYEHQHKAIVWRMPRLPKEGQGRLFQPISQNSKPASCPGGSSTPRKVAITKMETEKVESNFSEVTARSKKRELTKISLNALDSGNSSQSSVTSIRGSSRTSRTSSSKASNTICIKAVICHIYMLVIRNIPTAYPEDSVLSELKEDGYTITSVARMRNQPTKKALPMLLVAVPNTPQTKKLLNLQSIAYIKIKVEPYVKPKETSQCYKCQRFHHVSDMCHATPRCVKVGIEHTKGDGPNAYISATISKKNSENTPELQEIPVPADSDSDSSE
ncbi:protein stoned-B [Belonocnema kinseyi]|uniref:protein stoned-B n=1 Tax=Belonocnema kinseyi TaxID=2817044 RepID=UPI00143CC209|nr:protein stoned-B [Belonocnema kinseyi]